MNKNAQITILVYRNTSKSSWEFAGAADTSGNLVVGGKGAVQIHFQRRLGETWEFMDPFITFGEYGSAKNLDIIPGVLVRASFQPDAVGIVDTNTQPLYTAGFYSYALHTDIGVIDPTIVNDGGP